MTDQPVVKPQVHLVNDGEGQEIIYQANLKHAVTGEEEHINVRVTGFNHPGAAVRALIDTATHLMKVLTDLSCAEVHTDGVLTDGDIAKLLGSADN